MLGSISDTLVFIMTSKLDYYIWLFVLLQPQVNGSAVNGRELDLTNTEVLSQDYKLEEGN